MLTSSLSYHATPHGFKYVCSFDPWSLLPHWCSRFPNLGQWVLPPHWPPSALSRPCQGHGQSHTFSVPVLKPIISPTSPASFQLEMVFQTHYLGWWLFLGLFQWINLRASSFHKPRFADHGSSRKNPQQPHKPFWRSPTKEVTSLSIYWLKSKTHGKETV